MIVTRYEMETGNLQNLTQPFTLEKYKDLELIFAFDQSSTCTALTIGTRDMKIVEFITFERQKKTEETGSYMVKVERWVEILLSKANVLCYSLEDPILSGYVKSDKVVKQVYGVLKGIFFKAKCLDKEGNTVQVYDNADYMEINNKEWKAMIVPIDYFRTYEDPKIAVQKFVCNKIIPGLRRMPQDITDALCMYLFLVRTTYGNVKLRANKSSINLTHNLVLHAIPFTNISSLAPEMRKLATPNSMGTTKLNKEQMVFQDKYREGFIKRYLFALNGEVYTDEYIESSLSVINKKILTIMQIRSKEEIAQLQLESEYLLQGVRNGQMQEFEFNDNLTVEENVRCFTHRNKNIFFSVIPKSLHYCYAIPMFDLILRPSEEILIIATKY